WAARRCSSSYTSGKSCAEAFGSPCSMADRIPVTSLMTSSITGADRTGQHRDVSPQGVAGCRAPSINTPIHLSLLVDKAERCARRSDRPPCARQSAQPAPVRHTAGDVIDGRSHQPRGWEQARRGLLLLRLLGRQLHVLGRDTDRCAVL